MHLNISTRSLGKSAPLPNIGIAVAGGGYRALMNGAGTLAASDDRTQNATGKGQLGGLLQSATYLSGLSGGAWLVGSVYANNFSTVQTYINDNGGSTADLWQFQNSIFEGPDPGILSTYRYFQNLKKDVESKSKAGYDTSITDYWGRALSAQLVNSTNGGIGTIFNLESLETFAKKINGEQIIPFLQLPMTKAFRVGTLHCRLFLQTIAKKDRQ